MVLEGGNIKIRGDLVHLSQDLVEKIAKNKSELVASLRGYSGGQCIPEGLGGKLFPLTEMQRAYFLGRGSLYELGGISSHVYHEFECSGLDPDRLEVALCAVIKRQSALRLCVESAENQRIASIDSVQQPLIAVHDLRALAPRDLVATLLAIRERMSHEVVNARAPLIPRVELALLPDGMQLLFVGHDGLAVDGLSMQMLFAQWQQAYEMGSDTLEPLDVDFSDYVAALQSQQGGPWHARARSYWLERLKQEALPGSPRLPLVCSPKQIKTVRVTRHSVCLCVSQYQAFKARVGRHGLTATAAILAAYVLVLKRWSDMGRFSLTVTVADRIPFDSHVAEMIGNFTTSGIFVGEHVKGQEFRHLANAVLKQLQEIADHRQFSATEVLRELGRESGRTVLQPFTFNSAIDYPGLADSANKDGLFRRRRFGVSQTPQVWLNAFVISEGGGVEVQLDAVDGLFPPKLVEDIAASMQTMLERLCAHESAWYSDLSGFDLPCSQTQARAESNSTAVPMRDMPAWAGIMEQVELRPSAIAVVDPAGGPWTYSLLYQKAIAIAQQLKKHLSEQDRAVAISVDKSNIQIAALLGVLLSGRAYLPLERGWPAARVERALQVAGVAHVLSVIGDETHVFKEVDCFEGLVLSASMKGEYEATLCPGGQSDKPAYLMCTSGTTSNPKIVEISHRSLNNLIADCQNRFGLGSDTVVLATSSLAFDLSVFDVLCTLSSGGRIVLPARDKSRDIDHWINLVMEQRVTLWNAVPQVFSAVVARLEECAQVLTSLGTVLMSGDRVPPSLPAQIRKAAPNATLHALGGPTENTVWNIHQPLSEQTDSLERIPYGKPTSNNRYHILNSDGHPTPDWVVGELHAAGVGLATGYIGADAADAARFKYDAGLQERLYATGDLGRYLPDGSIEILGRADFQLKLNGYRIDPGEIESVLLQETGVTDCIVQAVQRGGGQLVLVVAIATCEPACQRPALIARLQERAALNLPLYAQPELFHCMDEMPLSANGKVDRKDLFELISRTLNEGGLVSTSDPGPEPSTDTQIAMARIWATVLGHQPAGIDSSFVAEGGDSLLAARVALAIRRQWRLSVELEVLLQLNSIRHIAAHIESVSQSITTQ
jgi:amino acid adenylation domain-containing protein